MGKYMRKAKITGDVVAVMEPSTTTSLGVCTRARTLALQRLQQSSSSDSSLDYLQLRSRRLEKPPTPTDPSGKQQPKNLESDSYKLKSHSRFLVTSGTEDLNEISFGENNSLDFQPRDRSTRESTPCSLVREADTMTNSGSDTQRTSLNTAQRTRNSMLSYFPSAHEIEEFFTFAEQQQQCLFMEKYNFDVVTDLPVPGRYEWIRVDH